MNDNNNITSRVMGVVYLDLVAYILPGFLLLSGMFVIFGDVMLLVRWLKTGHTMAAIALLIIAGGASYMVGSILSVSIFSIKKTLEGRFAWACMSGLLEIEKPGSFLQTFYTRRVGLPHAVRVELSRRIQEDLAKLGLLNALDGANQVVLSRESADFFWEMLREVSSTTTLQRLK